MDWTHNRNFIFHTDFRCGRNRFLSRSRWTRSLFTVKAKVKNLEIRWLSRPTKFSPLFAQNRSPLDVNITDGYCIIIIFQIYSVIIFSSTNTLICAIFVCFGRFFVAFCLHFEWMFQRISDMVGEKQRTDSTTHLKRSLIDAVKLHNEQNQYARSVFRTVFAVFQNRFSLAAFSNCPVKWWVCPYFFNWFSVPYTFQSPISCWSP